jgi:2-polyprenyl-3-methyl-5-hydroxy-6-metoxy-1,4-benzoquinol methylase
MGLEERSLAGFSEASFGDNRSIAPGNYRSFEATYAVSYVLPKILRFLPARNLRILDVGCGNGFMVKELADRGHHSLGLDPSETGIRIARHSNPKLRFEVASAYDDLRELVGEVDVVLASEVIEHLYLPKAFLRRAFACLNPGGLLIVTTPYHGYWKNLALSLFNHWDSHLTVDWDGGHIKFFSEKTLSKMITEIGFQRVRFNNAGRAPWLWKSIVCAAEKPKNSLK